MSPISIRRHSSPSYQPNHLYSWATDAPGRPVLAKKNDYKNHLHFGVLLDSIHKLKFDTSYSWDYNLGNLAGNSQPDTRNHQVLYCNMLILRRFWDWQREKISQRGELLVESYVCHITQSYSKVFSCHLYPCEYRGGRSTISFAGIVTMRVPDS